MPAVLTLIAPGSTIGNTNKETMSTTATIRKPKIKELTKDQARRLFNRQAKHHLNISGKEFIKRWEAGKFNGNADTPEVIRLAMLLPFGR